MSCVKSIRRGVFAASTAPRCKPVLPLRPQRVCSSRIVVCSANGAAQIGIRLAGVGSSAPATVLSNTELSKLVDTNDEWITSRTGIKRRHLMAEGEKLSHHAGQACKNALEMANLQPTDVDLILLATSTPDDIFGSATQVQAAIGAKNAVCFDLTAACSGFVIALVTGSQFIKTGSMRNVLVVGADALSRFVDWRDRKTCILFGDGCGAVLLSATSDAPCGLLGMEMHSDGAGHKSLNCLYSPGTGPKPLLEDAHASAPATYNNIHMAGQDVFKFAVRSVPTVIESALEKAGLQKTDVDWLVMHQANQRIMDAAAERLGLPAERVISNLAEYGNTSAASIPLALDEAVRGGQIKKGDVIAMAGFGAGLTWASCIVRWG